MKKTVHLLPSRINYHGCWGTVLVDERSNVFLIFDKDTIINSSAGEVLELLKTQKPACSLCGEIK